MGILATLMARLLADWIVMPLQNSNINEPYETYRDRSGYATLITLGPSSSGQYCKRQHGSWFIRLESREFLQYSVIQRDCEAIAGPPISRTSQMSSIVIWP